MNCRNCAHWRFSEPKQGGREPGWLLAHGFAACALGESWQAYGQSHECHNGGFQKLPENQCRKRAAYLLKIRETRP